MKYIFEVNVYTDGDFGFQFVPRGMEFDGGYEYTLEKSYDDRDVAIKDITNICVFLKEQMETSRKYVREDWNRCIDDFVKRLYASNKSEHERVEEYMSGNYDGTEFIFRAEAQRLKCDFCVTDEEYEMIKSNRSGVTIGMVKEAVLALFKK